MINLLTDISNNPSRYIDNVNTGEEFELSIKRSFILDGYFEIHKGKKSFGRMNDDEYKRIKKLCHKRNNSERIENKTIYNKHIIHQPYGSQKYPDLLIFEQAYIIPVELKFTKKRKSPGIWNNGIPTQNGIYIFGSKQSNQITFFRGCDYTSDEETGLFKSFYDKITEAANVFNREYMRNQPFGLRIEPREHYVSSRKSNPNPITDMFNSEYRIEAENNVLREIKEIQDGIGISQVERIKFMSKQRDLF